MHYIIFELNYKRAHVITFDLNRIISFHVENYEVAEL